MTQDNWQALMDAGNQSYEQNRTVQAEQSFLQALAVAQESDNHADRVATSLHNLAAVYHTQGKYAWAEEKYKQALEIRERVFGPESQEVATNMYNLALLYSARRLYEDADKLYRRVVEILEKLHGSEGAELVPVLKHYAEMLRRMGRVDQADTLDKRTQELSHRP